MGMGSGKIGFDNIAGIDLGGEVLSGWAWAIDESFRGPLDHISDFHFAHTYCALF